MTHNIIIGNQTDHSNKPVKLDVQRLMASRLLVTASSGGGKSWLLRKILEGVSKTTQTIVIDVEGEFASLRELRDMVLAGPHGEAPAEPRSAGLLCRQLMELNLSAVIDISELTPAERRSFVNNFCTTLVNLPRSLWRPCFICVDETHEFAAEGAKSESSDAIAMLVSKGRKRGYCLLAASQRLSKLSKDVAAELRNVFIGQTGLDVDLKRAADALGLIKAQWHEIRDLSKPKHEGEFFAFGPALSARGVIRFRSGPVETTHPEAGRGRLARPPEPSAKILGVLDKLKDLPKKAEEEIRDLNAAQRKITELERQLRAKPVPVAVPVKPLVAPLTAADHKKCTREIQQRDQFNQRLRQALEAAMKYIIEINAKDFFAKSGRPLGQESIEKAIKTAVQTALRDAENQQLQIRKALEGMIQANRRVADNIKRVLEKETVTAVVNIQHNEPFTVAKKAASVSAPAHRESPNGEAKHQGSLGKGEFKTLTAIAQHPDGVTAEQLTILTGYKRSSRNTYLQHLRSGGFIESGDPILATAQGIVQLGADYRPLPTGSALLQHWLTELGGGEKKILELVAASYPNPVESETISELTGYTRSSRNTYLQHLKARKLVKRTEEGILASSQLFDGG